jgi:hypothetical protein
MPKKKPKKEVKTEILPKEDKNIVDSPTYTTGRPPFYTSPEQMQKKITKYFESGMKKKEIVVRSGNGQKVVEIEVPTITGLCLYLGFCDRNSFYNYADRKEFSYTIKMARTLIEQTYEEIAQTVGHSGAIFCLKNFGWRDTQELEIRTHLHEENAGKTHPQILQEQREKLALLDKMKEQEGE